MLSQTGLLFVAFRQGGKAKPRSNRVFVGVVAIKIIETTLPYWPNPSVAIDPI